MSVENGKPVATADTASGARMRSITSLSADAMYMTATSAMRKLWRVVVRDGRRRRRAKDDKP